MRGVGQLCMKLLCILTQNTKVRSAIHQRPVYACPLSFLCVCVWVCSCPWDHCQLRTRKKSSENVEINEWLLNYHLYFSQQVQNIYFSLHLKQQQIYKWINDSRDMEILYRSKNVSDAPASTVPQRAGVSWKRDITFADGLLGMRLQATVSCTCLNVAEFWRGCTLWIHWIK